MKQVSMDNQGKRVKVGAKRVGRPRIKWYGPIRDKAIERLINIQIIPNRWGHLMRNEELDDLIMQAATQRLFRQWCTNTV